MKYFIMIAFACLTATSYGQVSGKKQILDRVDFLLLLTTEAQDALKEKDFNKVCKNVYGIFRSLPDHLLTLGIRLNQFDPRAVRMIQETQGSLIEVHRIKNLCDRNAGDSSSFLQGEPKRAILSGGKILNDLEKRLTYQKKKLPKMDTDYSNFFNYSYEFN